MICISYYIERLSLALFLFRLIIFTISIIIHSNHAPLIKLYNVVCSLIVFLQIREAQLAQYNYILVVGEDEAKTGEVVSIILLLLCLKYVHTCTVFIVIVSRYLMHRHA